LGIESQYENLSKNFPNLSKERRAEMFNSEGVRLNCHYINNTPKDVLDLLLCVFTIDKHITDIKLDDNTYSLSIVMKDDLMGDSKVNIKILKLNEKTSVIDYMKASGDLMSYYKQIKRI
jgi:hypothetical protein